MELSRHIQAINAHMGGLFEQMHQLRVERHLPSKSPADKELTRLEQAAIRFRREILKLPG